MAVLELCILVSYGICYGICYMLVNSLHYKQIIRNTTNSNPRKNEIPKPSFARSFKIRNSQIAWDLEEQAFEVIR